MSDVANGPVETFESTESMEARVARLLRQVEDLRRHGEDATADVALAKAEKIMLKFSIERAVVEARLSVDRREPIETVWLPFTGIYRMVMAPQLGQLVAAYSSAVRTFVSSADKTYYLALVGRPGDTTPLRMLIASLQLQAMAGMNVWWRDAKGSFNHLTSMQRYKTRRQFVTSFVQGATARVRRARAIVTESTTSTVPGTELALRDYEGEVDAYVAERFKLTSGRSRVASGHVDAAVDGYAAGQRANTGDVPVGHGRRQLTT